MHGIWTALVTPFDGNGKIDFQAFERILADQISAQVSGVVVCGSTGETPTLSLQERQELVCKAVAQMRKTNVQVLVGAGSNNTQDSIEFSQWAEKQDVSGVMLVAPYYNKPTQAGMKAHFLKIANSVSCPIVLYNVPGRTVVSIAPETVAELATHPRIRALKEATGNIAFASEILDQLKTRNLTMDLLSGDDATYLPFLAVGGKGAVSVASNLFPREMVAIQKAFDENRNQDAQKLQSRFYPLFRDLFIEPNPVPVKYAMSLTGLCKPYVRLPLVEMSSANQEKVARSFEACGLKRKE